MTATLIADGAPLDVKSAAGSGVRLRLDITDDDGQPQDITGWTFAGQLRWRPSDEVASALSFDTATAGASGTVYVTLADTDANVGRYGYAIEYDDGSGLGFVPLVYGTWTLREQWRY